MNPKQQSGSGLHFSKRFLKFAAIFLVSLLLLMAYLHWRKGDYRLQVPVNEPMEQNQ